MNFYIMHKIAWSRSWCDGATTFFWSDLWLEGGLLCDWFINLYLWSESLSPLLKMIWITVNREFGYTFDLNHEICDSNQSSSGDIWFKSWNLWFESFFIRII